MPNDNDDLSTHQRTELASCASDIRRVLDQRIISLRRASTMMHEIEAAARSGKPVELERLYDAMAETASTRPRTSNPGAPTPPEGIEAATLGR